MPLKLGLLHELSSQYISQSKACCILLIVLPFLFGHWNISTDHPQEHMIKLEPTQAYVYHIVTICKVQYLKSEGCSLHLGEHVYYCTRVNCYGSPFVLTESAHILLSSVRLKCRNCASWKSFFPLVSVVLSLLHYVPAVC